MIIHCIHRSESPGTCQAIDRVVFVVVVVGAMYPENPDSLCSWEVPGASVGVGCFFGFSHRSDVQACLLLNPKKHKRVQIFNEIHRDLCFFTLFRF
jgi:hypothetical protein